jgi:hypothetical protein
MEGVSHDDSFKFSLSERELWDLVSGPNLDKTPDYREYEKMHGYNLNNRLRRFLIDIT